MLQYILKICLFILLSIFKASGHMSCISRKILTPFSLFNNDTKNINSTGLDGKIILSFFETLVIKIKKSLTEKIKLEITRLEEILE